MAGKSVRISLEIQREGLETGRDIGCWSNPELLARSLRTSPPNVVLISIDTLRADGLSLYGNPRPTSPSIDLWAKNHGVVFTRAVAQAPWTLPSHTSMFTGIDAIRHGASHNGPAPQSLQTLAEILRDAGYTTMAVTGGAYLHPQFGLAQGFDVFKYWPDKEKNTWNEVDAVTEAAGRLLNRSDNAPFFLFIHTYEVHNCGQPREEFFRRVSSLDTDLTIKVVKDERCAEDGYVRRMRSMIQSSSDDQDWLDLPEEVQAWPRDVYDSRVNYADQRLAPILGSLSQEPLRNNSLVVLTSDHGEMLGEHGYSGHIYLYEENILVPLIIASDKLRAAGTSVPHQVRSIDIVPTVLELVGLEPEDGLDGQSLVPLISGAGEKKDREAWTYVATSNRGISVTMPSVKYIFNDTAWSPINQSDQCFNLGTADRESEDSVCPDALRKQLHAQITSRVLATMSGIRMRFINNLSKPIIAVLHGQPVTRSRVKSVGAPPGTRIQFRKRSKARIRIPAGADFTVFLMDTKNQEFSVSFYGNKASSLPVWKGEFRMLDIGSGKAVCFNGGEWHSGSFDEHASGDVALLVLPDRSTPTESESSEELDDELRAQLEALGYL